MVIASLGNTTLTVALPAREVLAHPAPAQPHGDGFRRDAEAHRPAKTSTRDFHARAFCPVWRILARMKLYCWNVNGIRAVVKKGHLSEIHRRAPAGHPVPAGNQGREGPGGDRPPGLSRVLELGREEGLFGHGDLLEAGAAQGHQRLSRQRSRRSSRSPTSSSATPGTKGASSPPSSTSSTWSRCTRRMPRTTCRALKLRHKHWDPAFLAYVQTAREEEAGDLLRRPQRRAHRARSRESRSRTAARKASPTRSAKASRISSTPASSTPSACSRKATATIPGGAISPTRARATWDGESTTCWCPEALKKKVKEAKIHADVMG